MNKTFNMALAVAAAASMVCAEIETAPAGYVDVTGTSAGVFVGTPFAGFDGNVATLGDIDGSQLNEASDGIKVYSSVGKVLFSATYKTVNNVPGWYDINNGCSNSFPLARGTAIQLVSNGNTITFAGRIAEGNVSVNLVKGHNYIANASPISRTLGDFIVAGSKYNPLGSDYIYVNGQKLVYLNSATASKAGLSAGWYLKSAITGTNPSSAVKQDTTAIAAGTGIRGYFTKANGTDAAVFTTPGL